MQFYVKTSDESLEWARKNRSHTIASMPKTQGKHMYANMLNEIESIHWTNAEMHAPHGSEDFSIAVGFGPEYNKDYEQINKEYVLICDGPREVGPEHRDQLLRMSQAFRELINKTLEDTKSDEKKELLNSLLEDYNKYGCDYSLYQYFNKTQYDDGTIRDVSKEKEEEHKESNKEFYDFFDSIFNSVGHERKDKTPDKSNPFSDAKPKTEPEGFGPFKVHAGEEPSIDDLISRATAISEQSKGLAEDLGKFRDEFEIE